MKANKLLAPIIVILFLATAFNGLALVHPATVAAGQTQVSPSQPTVDKQLTQALKNDQNPEWLAYQRDLAAGKISLSSTAQGYQLGEIPSPVNLSQLTGKNVDNIAAVGYAASFDLRTLGKVTSVKNQNPCGTCWAFATYGSLESFLRTAETRDFSEYNLARLAGFDRSGANWCTPGGGNAQMSTAYLARWAGPVNEVNDPYPYVGTSTTGTYTVQKRVQNVFMLPDRANSLDNNNIKWALTTYGGVYDTIYWDSAYYSSNPATYYYPYSSTTNHAVTIVGWNDNYAASNFRGAAGTPPGNGAFIVKNSWGTSWGDGGYFYLSYYDKSLSKASVFTAEPTSNYATEYQYDPLGWTTSLSTGSTTAWGANIFTASSNGPLTAVSFYTTDVNTKYEVYVYTNPTSGPIGGTKYVGPTGTIPMPGYHTVKLASLVPLKSGQRFSVVVKFTTSGYRYPLATEMALSGYSSAATASAGQSYASSDGTSWSDVTSRYSSANLCIKAFAAATQPTTFNLMPASQSAQPNANVQLTGYLRTGATGIGGQPVELWAQSGAGAWSKVGTGRTGTGASAGYVTFNVGATPQVAQTNQYYLMFQSAGAYAAAKSNVITIKFESAKTTPYQTALYAYAPKPVVPHGTTNTMYVKLTSGATPLTGQYVYVWKYSGGKFVIVSRIITRTAAQSPGAGWAQADYRLNNVGTGLYQFTFFGSSPYDRSTSNTVQLRWT
jgi:C1A family cysteine protease